MEQKYTGLVLSKTDTGEADRLYSVYTLEAGKIRARAAGVRKPASKLAGSLENFTLADIAVVKRNGLGKIKSAITENIFLKMRSDADAVFLAAQMAALFDRMTKPGEKDEKMFNLLADYFSALDEAAGDAPKLEVLSAGFLLQLLNFSGYALGTRDCAVCGGTFASRKNFISPAEGGLVCAVCAAGKKSNFFPVSENGVKLLRLASSHKIKKLLKIKMEEREAREARKALEAFACEVVFQEGLVERRRFC